MSDITTPTQEAVATLSAGPSPVPIRGAWRRRAGPLLFVAFDLAAVAGAMVAAALAGALLSAVPWGAMPYGSVHLLAIGAGIALPALLFHFYSASVSSPVERFRDRVLAAAMLPVIGMAVIGVMLIGIPVSGLAAPDSAGWRDGLLLALVAAFHLPLALAAEARARNILLARGLWGEDVVVIGSPEAAAAVARELSANRQLGLCPITIWTLPSPGGELGEVPLLAASARLAVVAAEPGVKLPALGMLPFRRILVVPTSIDLPQGARVARPLGAWLGIEIGNPMALAMHRWAKRALDLLVAVPALVLVLPVILGAALAIRLASPGPAIYRQLRVGYRGRPVAILKLRTMFIDADQRLEELLRTDPAAKAEWNTYVKLANDPRILPAIGTFLRRSSIDELPQLWNVIRGDISLVGPRPFPAYHIARFDPEFQRLRSSIRPGLTGLWQVTDRSGASLERQKDIDTDYIRNWSLWLDLYIVWCTLPAVLRARGAR